MYFKNIFIFSILIFCFSLVNAETLEFESELPTPSAEILSINKRPTLDTYKPTKSANITFSPSGFTVEEEVALRYAIEIWARALPASASINVIADFNCFSTTLAYKASTTILTCDSSQISYPTSLYNYLFDTPSTETDITIHFNSDKSIWHFNTDSSIPVPNGKYDFVTQALRAIGFGLGFGSSVSGTTIIQAARYDIPYIFDTFIRDQNDTRLTSLKNRTTDFRNFIRNNTYFAFDNYSDYQLHSPSEYKNYVTLKYFATEAIPDQEKALMYPEVNGRCHTIGEKIIDILETIGWEEKNLRIICHDIDETGIVTFDPSKEFIFSTSGLKINNIKWRFEILKNDMSTELIQYSTGNAFSISLPEDFDQNDYRTAEGYIRCLISATGTTDSGETKTASYSLFVEFRPPTPKMWLMNSQLINGRYQLTFGINAYGANRYNITEYNSAISSMTDYDIRQSGFATWINPYIIKDYYFSFTIRAFNNYGQSDEICYDLNGIDITKPITEPIELPIANQVETNVEIGNLQSPEIVSINIFSLSGQKLISCSGNYYNIHLPNGVYIKESIYNTGEKSINKVIF